MIASYSPGNSVKQINGRAHIKPVHDTEYSIWLYRMYDVHLISGCLCLIQTYTDMYNIDNVDHGIMM